MNFAGVEVVCPACRHDLRSAGEGLCCAACGRQYPIVYGIPDLRLRPDPYVGMEEDRAIGRALAAQCRGLDFPSSIEVYYRQADKVPQAQAGLFRRGLLAAAARSQARLEQWHVSGPANGSLLDLGCGTAPLLLAARPHFEPLVGVDIAFRWLVMAQKRLEDAGAVVPLICACAEALPFPDRAFDCVAADAVLEHASDQAGALAECRRALRPQGRLLLATPNRFSLGPDPHVGLWAGGYLPKRWIDGYARRLGGIPPHRRLLSSRDLRRLLEAAGFTPSRIGVPGLPPGQRAQFGLPLRVVAAIYDALRHLPLAQQVLAWVGPMLVASAQKPAEP